MRFLSAAFFSIVLFSSPALAAKIELAGQVTYRERIALPPDAKLTGRFSVQNAHYCNRHS